MTNKIASLITRRTIVSIVIFILTLLSALMINASEVNAADKSTIMKKWLYTQFYSCLESEINNSPLPQKTDNSLVAEEVFRKEGTMYLPSFNFQYNGAYKFVNCYELFNGSGGIAGLKNDAANNNATWSSQESTKSFLSNMGYAFESTEDISFKLNLVMEKCNYDYNTAYNPKDCNLKEAIDKKTEPISSSLISIDSKTGTYSIDNNTMGENFTVDVDNKGQEIIIKVHEEGWLADKDEILFDDVDKEIRIPFGSSPQETIKNIENKLPNLNWLIRRTTNDAFAGTKYTIKNYYFNTSDMTTVIQDGNYYFAKIQTRFNVSNQVVHRLSGMSVPTLALTPSEKYTLYVYYLDKSIPTSISPRITCSPESTANLVQVRLKDSDGEFKTCYANFNNTKPSSISVYTQLNKVGPSRVKVPYITTITMQGVIDWLNETSSSELDDVEAIDVINTSDNTGDTTEDAVEPNCTNSGAAASLGWIVCPLLNWLSDAATSMYDDWIKPALAIEPKLFTEGNGAVLQAWGIFQGLANIAMIVIFLIVIFSQITGVGIDNYGIKKILPKLIVAAILINLSYIICQIFIDVSNIVGNALQNLFNSYQPEIDLSAYAVDSAAEGAKSIGMTGLTGVTLLGLIAVSIWAIVSEGGGQALLLALIISAITIVVSIFFLFVLLSAREAAIIVLTVISPLAFACNILPNTKNYFDKWLKFGRGLLLVYPISGLLVGGGNFISKVLLVSGQGNDGFFSAFMAMIIGVVPIFFIPSVLKGALNTVGNLGNRISGIGKTVGSRISGNVERGIKNTAGYKERQARWNSDRQFRQNQVAGERAERIRNRLNGQDNLTDRQKAQLYAAESTLIAQKDRERRAETMRKSGYDAALTAIEKKADAEDIANHMVLINSKTANGANQTELERIFKEFMDNNDINGAVAAARIAGRRKDTASSFLANTIMKDNDYSAEALSKVSKEISEGENSKNYRSASPLGFEYASRVNEGNAVGASGATGAPSYSDWSANQDNIKNALNHHVTDSGELVGIQSKNLEAIADKIESKDFDAKEAERIRALAKDTINNRDKGPWDTTKADDIYRLAYGQDYQQQMAADGVPSSKIPQKSHTITFQGASGPVQFTSTENGWVDNQGNAIEGAEFDIQVQQAEQARQQRAHNQATKERIQREMAARRTQQTSTPTQTSNPPSAPTT